VESETKWHFSSAYNPSVEFTVYQHNHPSTNLPAHLNNPLAHLLTYFLHSDFDEHRGHVRMKPGHARRLLRALDAQYLNQVRMVLGMNIMYNSVFW
jgi:hypothetical protein